jgi:hypothetical protein
MKVLHNTIFERNTITDYEVALVPFISDTSFNGSTVLCWALVASFSVVILQTVGKAPWVRDQPVPMPLPTHRTTQTQNKHTKAYMPRI